MTIDSSFWQLIVYGFWVGLGFWIANLVVEALKAGIKRMLT